MMARSPDDKPRIPQADFDRITAATRDDWRKWERRRLVAVRSTAGYSWTNVVEALVLIRLEASVGLTAVVQVWDDVRQDLRSQIRQPQLDLVFDPGTSPDSRPQMRAHLSIDDATLARLARAARTPVIIPLARELEHARAEFERVIHRASAHADRPKKPNSQAQDEAPGIP